MTLTEPDKRLLALHFILPVPLNRLNRLFKKTPDLEYMYELTTIDWMNIAKLPEQKANQLKKSLLHTKTFPYDKMYEEKQIIPVPFTHPFYPESLHHLVDPPAVLYAKGDIKLLKKRKKIAVIGSRKATTYSMKALSYIVPPLVQKDAVIVSGMAKGADTMAHQAAMQYGGHTIGVLGHGFSHFYPKENLFLAEQMKKEQLLLTEYPPYVKPAKWTFPMRNRIISGLSEAVIVTESAEKSGTMITVEHALDHGKHVFAVPGSITSPLSVGTNKLLYEGAQPIWHGFQATEALF